MVFSGSEQARELRPEPGAGRDAARSQLAGDAGGAGIFGAPQPPAAHRAAALLRARLPAVYRRLLLRRGAGSVSLLLRWGAGSVSLLLGRGLDP